MVDFTILCIACNDATASSPEPQPPHRGEERARDAMYLQGEEDSPVVVEVGRAAEDGILTAVGSHRPQGRSSLRKARQFKGTMGVSLHFCREE